jgi:hypothetical protein
MGGFALAKEWVRKYQHLYPENELFAAIDHEEELQPEVVVDSKLAEYERMLDANTRRLREQPPDQY